MKNEFVLAILGGVLIGLASAIPLWWQGKVAGASGLLSNIFSKLKADRSSALLYVLGLVLGAFFLVVVNEDLVASRPIVLDLKLIVGALLVGFGARLGSGCTSGHGVCGMARLSMRSIVATLIFLGTAMIVANLLRAFV